MIRGSGGVRLGWLLLWLGGNAMGAIRVVRPFLRFGGKTEGEDHLDPERAEALGQKIIDSLDRL